MSSDNVLGALFPVALGQVCGRIYATETKIPCEACGGLGFLSHRTENLNEPGASTAGVVAVSCPHCDGFGEITVTETTKIDVKPAIKEGICQTCKGTGKVKSLWVDLVTMEAITATEEVDCPDCGGDL